MRQVAWQAARVAAWFLLSLLASIFYATVVVAWGYMLIVHWKLFPDLLQ